MPKWEVGRHFQISSELGQTGGYFDDAASPGRAALGSPRRSQWHRPSVAIASGRVSGLPQPLLFDSNSSWYIDFYFAAQTELCLEAQVLLIAPAGRQEGDVCVGAGPHLDGTSCWREGSVHPPASDRVLRYIRRQTAARRRKSLASDWRLWYGCRRRVVLRQRVMQSDVASVSSERFTHEHA